jgi:hypothetical protein
LRVRQALALLRQLRQLAGPQAGVVQLLALEADQGQFALPLLPPGRQRGVPAAQLAHAVGKGDVPAALLFEVAVGVEELELVRGLEERLALALAVDVHEGLAELAQGADGDRLVVDVGVTAAGAGEAPREDQLVVVKGGVEEALHLAAQLGARQLEAAGDAQLVGAGP